MLPALAFAAGLVFGSFANVVASRSPRGGSLVRPPSACPRCSNPIRWHDNVPLVSYAILRGRCRDCGEKISARYPLVELGTAVVWAALARRIGLNAELPAFLAFGFFLVVLSAVDLEEKRLPNVILGPGAAAAAVLLAAAAAFDGDARPLLEAASGGLSYGIAILVLALLVPHGMGMGDVKFSAYLGLHLGWFGLDHVLAGALLAFFSGGLAGVAMVLLKRAGMKSQIPFGPFLAAGALAAVLWGDELIELWLPS